MVFVFFNKIYFSRCLAGLLLFALPLIPITGFTQGDEDENKSPVSVEVYVAPAKATIGDIITYTFRVRHDANIEPFPPKFAPPEGLEFIDQGIRKLPTKNNHREQEFWFRLRADQVGSYDFPPIPLPFEATREGNESEKIPGHIMTPKAELEIESILRLQGEPTDIRDIKSLEAIGKDWLPWVWRVLAVLIVIALVILYLRRKRKQNGAPFTSVKDNLSPRELAFQELEALVNRELLEKGLVREYYFELSEIFRRYLGGRYEFQALDWTTEEIKNHLLHSPAIEIQFSGKIINILEITDLVKFAKAPATRAENMMEEIILMIQATSRAEETDPALKNTPTRS
jgi:hypothetical protein